MKLLHSEVLDYKIKLFGFAWVYFSRFPVFNGSELCFSVCTPQLYGEKVLQRYFAKPNSLLMKKKVTPGLANSACINNWTAVMHSDSKTRKRTFNMFSTRNVT